MINVNMNEIILKGAVKIIVLKIEINFFENAIVLFKNYLNA